MSDYLAAKTDPDSLWDYELNDYARPCVMQPADDCSAMLPCVECPALRAR